MTQRGKYHIKLAEALSLRATVQREQEKLESKIQSHLVIKKNETPEENAATDLETYMTRSTQLRELIVAINVTNIGTSLGDGTITSAIAERDRLGSVLGMLRRTKSTLRNASVNLKGRTPKEKDNEVLVFEVKNVENEIRRLEKLRSQLDMKLQFANWETQLILDEESPAWELIFAARELENTSSLESVFDKRSIFRTFLSKKSPW